MVTHDWTHMVDVKHLADIRSRADQLAPGGLTHLILEVLAYSDDEGADLGREVAVTVTVGDDRVEIADDGRGTEIRFDHTGAVVRKPVMSTRDVRFFDAVDGPLLPDGHPRRGLSVVAALSPVLVHENRRVEGSWSQTYHFGVPSTDLEPLAARDRTGTTVRLTLPPGHVPWDGVRRAAGGFRHLSVDFARD